MSLRSQVGRALADVLGFALRGTRPRVIRDHGGTSPYLSRWYLAGGIRMPDGSNPFDAHGDPRVGYESLPGLGLVVHRFHRGDLDRELHNHPWEWALSFVVAGGYREERRIGPRTVWRIVPPLSFNWIGKDDFHRVALLEKDAWTIFLTGPKTSSWGFWSRETDEVIPWRAFLARKRGGLS